jgi:hypothetical protein
MQREPYWRFVCEGEQSNRPVLPTTLHAAADRQAVGPQKHKRMYDRRTEHIPEGVRKAAKQQVDSLKLVAGILVKATRAYKSSSDPDGATQSEVGKAANPVVSQPEISKLENGTFIPADPQISHVLKACGFDLAKPGASTFFKLLQFIRDNEADLGQLESELPD